MLTQYNVGNEFVEQREFIFQEYGLDIYNICTFFGIKTPIRVEFEAMAETWENETLKPIDIGQTVVGVDKDFTPMFPNGVVNEPTLWIDTFTTKDLKEIQSIIRVQLLHEGETMDVKFIQLIKNRPEKVKKMRRKNNDHHCKTNDPVDIACANARIEFYG